MLEFQVRVLSLILIIDAVKPANCFYTGYFLIRYLKEAKSDTDKF